MDDLRAQLPEILHVLSTSDVYELELVQQDQRIRVHRTLNTDLNLETRQEEHGLSEVGEERSVTLFITSPLVGTFYRASTPGAPPLVDEGSQVELRMVVGIVEALQVLTEVEAGYRGIVSSALATDGQPVEYGQPLFEVTPLD